jgi:hypothetical protein
LFPISRKRREKRNESQKLGPLFVKAEQGMLAEIKQGGFPEGVGERAIGAGGCFAPLSIVCL